MELDTHANNTVLGNCCLLIHDTGRKVDVLGFSTALRSIELPIVSGAVAYDHPITGKVYFLVFHQAIYCCQMDNHLICPMQCRVNSVIINDTPKMCVPNPEDSTHSIEVTDPLDQDATLHIPLILKGVTSCCYVQRPTMVKFDDPNPLSGTLVTQIGPFRKPPQWIREDACMTWKMSSPGDKDS
jgi:hypothetical protein